MTDLQRWSDADRSGAGFFWGTVLPAAQWRSVVSGTVRVRVEGTGFVSLMARSGGVTREHARLRAGTSVALALDEDWYWFVPEDDSDVASVVWSIGDDVETPPVVAVVPTIGRVAETIAQVSNFLASRDVARVIVVDQAGGLEANEDFIGFLAESGERLRLITQANFGGSGGYARGMIESMAFEGHAVLLSDDDAFLPGESLRRMCVYQALAAARGAKAIVGTPVLDVDEPTSLRLCAEYVRDRDFFWTKADFLNEPRPTTSDPAELLDALERHAEPNYTGWWGCLLPAGTVDEVGLPAPFFLKWDDAEYGMRARRLGYEIQVLPGTGVWHPRWDTTSTLWSWSGVLSHRNRLAAAAATRASRGVLASSLAHQVKHILSLQYAVAGSWLRAGEQFASGAAWLGADLLEARPRAQRIWTEEQARSEAFAELTSGVGDAHPVRVRDWRAARNSTAIRAIVTLFAPSRLVSDLRSVPARTYAWWDSLGADRVLVEFGDRTVVLARDTARAWGLLGANIRQYADLALRWDRLTAEYSLALERESSLERWTTVLGAGGAATGAETTGTPAESGKERR